MFGTGWAGGRKGGFLGIMGLINRKLSEWKDDESQVDVRLLMSYLRRTVLPLPTGRRDSNAFICSSES